MDTEKVKQNPAVEAAGSSGGQAARIFKKENIPKTAETVGRDTFEDGWDASWNVSTARTGSSRCW